MIMLFQISKELALKKEPDSLNNEVKNSLNDNTKTISVLLNILNLDFDYSRLDGFDNIYIPLKYFSIKKYDGILKNFRAKI